MQLEAICYSVNCINYIMYSIKDYAFYFENYQCKDLQASWSYSLMLYWYGL
jgi:hypothetical protein